jgi:hypothetical protein
MMLDGLNKNSNSGDPITITVLRGKEDQKEIQLQGKVMKIAKVERNVLQDNPNATADQIKLREAWLSAK